MVATAKVDLVFFAILDPFIGALLRRKLAGRLRYRWTGIVIRDGFMPTGTSLPLQIRLRGALKLLMLRLLGAGGPGIISFNPFWRLWFPAPVHYLPESQSYASWLISEADQKGAPWPRPMTPSGEGRTTFRSFGGISERKGVLDCLLALDRLADNALRRVRFRILGPGIDRAYLARVNALAITLRGRGAQIDIDQAFLSPQALVDEIVACQVVVAPYRDHAGSSGVLGLALQIGRPVIGSAQHQAGQEIVTYDLGYAVRGKGDAWIGGLAAAVQGALTSPYLPTSKTLAWREVRNYPKAFAVALALFRGMVGV